MIAPLATRQRLHNLAQQAIVASATLTAASIAGSAITDAQYACIDHAAASARHKLLACLAHDHGIDAAMADQLGALL